VLGLAARGCPAMLGWPACRTTHFARCARYVQTGCGKSDHDAREYARGRPACASRRRTGRPVCAPPADLLGLQLNSLPRRPTPSPGPRGVRRRGDLCAAEEHRIPGRARTRALRELTRRRCLSAVSAANEASSATGQESEHRRAASRSEAKQWEPRRRATLGPALRQRTQTVNVNNGPLPGSHSDAIDCSSVSADLDGAPMPTTSTPSRG